LLEKDLDILVQKPNEADMQLTSTHRLVLEFVTKHATELPALRRAAFSVMTIKPAQDKLQHFLTQIHPSPDGTLDPLETDVAAVRQMQDRLGTSFCGLLLSSAIAAQQDEIQAPQVLISPLLNRHSHAPEATTNRAVVLRSSRRYNLLHDEITAPHTVDGLDLSWRERLSSTMQGNARQQELNMLDSVAQICQELEKRCDNVEEPLRAERQNLRELEERHRELESAYGSLEARLMDRDLGLSALEAENREYQAQASHAAEDHERLMQRVEEGNVRLRQASEQARADIAALHSTKQQVEMEHASTMACRQEELDASREDVRCLEQIVQEGKSQIEHQSNLLAQQLDDKQRLEQVVGELQNNLRCSSNDFQASTSRHEEVVAQFTALQKVLTTHENLAMAAQHECQNLKAELDETHAKARQDMSTATAHFEEHRSTERQKVSLAISNTNGSANSLDQWTKMQTHLEKQLNSLQHELAAANRSLENNACEAEKKIVEQRKKVNIHRHGRLYALLMLS